MKLEQLFGAALVLSASALLTIGCAARQPNYRSTNAAEAAGPQMSMGAEGETEYLQFGKPYRRPSIASRTGMKPSGMEAGRAQGTSRHKRSEEQE